MADKIFDGYGPLATFSAKTDMALLLGLITERVHKDINLIRKIRNIFAHEAEKVGFEIDQVKGLCAKLWPAEGIPRSDGTKNRIEGAKAQFLHSVFLCILHIDTELKRTQKIKVPKFHFEEVVD
ncbi:MAG: hypothetical protein HPY82_18880 [Gammaproteobacteria bacterium]|nr:hypothetical protein [Gammaproteobacteria bacterium]